MALPGEPLDLHLGVGHGRPKGHAPWNPRGERQAMLQGVIEVLDEHRAMGLLPLGPRQVG